MPPDEPDAYISQPHSHRFNPVAVAVAIIITIAVTAAAACEPMPGPRDGDPRPGARAIKALPGSDFKVEEIAVRALATFVGDPACEEVPSKDDQAASLLAEKIVKDLAAQPQYQIQSLKRSASELSSDESSIPPISSTRPSPPAPPPTIPPQPTSVDPIAPRRIATTRSIAARHTAVSISTTGQHRHTSPFPGWLLARTRLSGQAASSTNSFFSLGARPYQSHTERLLIARRTEQLGQALKDLVPGPTVYHVDFTQDEIAYIVNSVSPDMPKTAESLIQLGRAWDIPKIIAGTIPNRTTQDAQNFYSDLMAGKVSHPDQGRILTLQPNSDDATRRETKRISRVSSLHLAREIEGNRGFGHMRQYTNFQNEFRNAHEDGMTCIAEFTNCAGDIATTTWVPGNNIICGTTNHSDTHNQQYNKPGNLLLCSLSRGELRAFPDHRIPRPIVEMGENSTEAMRRSQDPWLYSSVVASDYDEKSNLAFTSSFDGTVKIWNVSKDGSSMTAIATWHLGGNVNFVSAAKDGSGRVATAADVPSEAVRIYTISKEDIANSPFVSFSCERTDADGSDKWAYFPATMQWGRSPESRHVLAVGYSPRSFSGSDHDIPEDKLQSGNVTLWDAEKGRRLHVTTATTSNFFEIIWHPTLPRFIAATTPGGLKAVRKIRTQIHIFQRDNSHEDSGYQEFQKLDCEAADINELTIMPNSLQHAYITAGCTDGNVYVWDTAQGDAPIHTLKHGHPIDEFHEDREREDTGVKFTAWGTTADRLYTGSSDGVVKVWNVRRRRSPFVRDLLVAPGPISCGAFSPDGTKLVVGDATGRVFLFSVDKRDAAPALYMTIPGTAQRRRRPIPFIHHPEPPPPPPPPQPEAEMQVDPPAGPDPNPSAPTKPSEADDARRTYLDTGMLILHSNPTIGAVQGPAYALTKLFRADAHLDGDPNAPLLPTYARQQRANAVSGTGSGALSRARSLRRLKDPALLADARFAPRHEVNAGIDFDMRRLDAEVLAGLMGEKAVLAAGDEDWGFEYEEMPDEI
ncbi:Rik1-associated factor 1 [Escovopsis weberi]|uniref:Rik1-associated factor 1 n=1 Tax=Escovopsis weberi TaxID=150374 RepID=A0A0M8MYW2_ESCWE|nr:Rik1-associated factor 1 [Escovopsis weberi]